MAKKFFALLLVAAAVGACDDTPVSPVDADPQFARQGPPADKELPAAVPGTSTIVELAQNTPALSTLVFALTTSDANCETNFVDVLSGNGQFTVFAPTNDAFDAIIGALGAEVVLSCDVLPTVLAYHVKRGRQTSGAVLETEEYRMLSGEIAVVDADALTVGGARLNLGLLDISASNGIVHVVDDVLVPPSINGG
jgi:transforming growth factor-beta-induced protein